MMSFIHNAHLIQCNTFARVRTVCLQTCVFKKLYLNRLRKLSLNSILMKEYKTYFTLINVKNKLIDRRNDWS